MHQDWSTCNRCRCLLPGLDYFLNVCRQFFEKGLMPLLEICNSLYLSMAQTADPCMRNKTCQRLHVCQESHSFRALVIAVSELTVQCINTTHQMKLGFPAIQMYIGCKHSKASKEKMSPGCMEVVLTAACCHLCIC